MRLKLFTLGLVLCISALAAPNEWTRCGRHSSASKPATGTIAPTATTAATTEQSSLLISRLLYNI